MSVHTYCVTMREADAITILRHMRETSVHDRIAEKIQKDVDGNMRECPARPVFTRSEFLLVSAIAHDYDISFLEAEEDPE